MKLTLRQQDIAQQILKCQDNKDLFGEKKLLQEALILYPKWEFIINRIKTLEALGILTSPDPQELKEQILRFSLEYQKNWCFEKELSLIEMALVHFPGWDYALKRREWHKRPIFHRDPNKSQTQPRAPLHLPRIESITPRVSTLKALCFVLASGSDQPYFDLSVQLLESLKATRWYKDIPIKILDCGLNIVDKKYLIERFCVEIKDPGWDVDPSKIEYTKVKPYLNGWKGCTSRPYIHRHFPGYDYYFWIDTDTWVQDERAIDQLICLCEKQGFAATREFHKNALWSVSSKFQNAYAQVLPCEMLAEMEGKKAFINSVYCIHKAIGEWLIAESEAVLSMTPYKWGFDLVIMNYIFHKYVPGGMILEDSWINNVDKFEFGVFVDANKHLMTNDKTRSYIGFVGLEGHLKHMPYRMLLSNDPQSTKKAFMLSKALTEEQLYIKSKNKGWGQGGYFYRIFPDLI